VTALRTIRNTMASPVVPDYTMAAPAVADCLADVITGCAFPWPKRGTVEVTYPFVF
jgi:hypothetical protein